MESVRRDLLNIGYVRNNALTFIHHVMDHVMGTESSVREQMHAYHFWKRKILKKINLVKVSKLSF